MDVMFLTRWHLNVFWFSFKQALQNGVKSVDVVSAKSNSPDSTAVTGAHIGISDAFDAPGFVMDGVARRCGELGGDGRSTFITRQLRDSWSLLFLFVARHSFL